MEQNRLRFKSIPENLFLLLLIANNFIALYFLSIDLMFVEFPANKYTSTEMYLILARSGFIISLFFHLSPY
ncbi:hypothetical protein MgSA37_00166 [Mucilaginibacter gotjawali]|uniref:Uncharacterized protein n=1 Tax=Mucilaginibacter gotjawali TaxID=1550579 RepID=A0A125T1X5_9SPHI|nr:hypothetical protein MgSA37_00166 [Mucilaginibacter gotjawali]